MYQELYQKVIEYYSLSKFKTEYDQSREIFIKNIGVLDDEHPFFETWIDSFIEFFTFDHVLPSYGITPLTLYFKMHADDLILEEVAGFQVLLNQKLIMAKVHLYKGDVLSCTNVFTGEKFVLYAPEQNLEEIVKKNDWLIVRTLIDKGQNIIFGSYWHFPLETTSHLKKNKEAFQSNLSFIHDCMKRKVFSEKFKHIDQEKVYKGEIDFQKFAPKEVRYAQKR